MRLLLTGATGQVGRFLLPYLSDANMTTLAISRQAQASHFNEKWCIADLVHDDPFIEAGDMDVWVHAGLLTLTLPWLESAARAGVKHLIAFSSTSIFTKLDSSSNAERTLIGNIRAAEDTIVDHCKRLNIHWTIFRPTLIYGNGTDQNISFIMNMIRHVGFFPLVGNGLALRQPVHAEDLALAVLKALMQVKTFDRAYNLSGGEILTYKAMVERVFVSLHKKPRIVRIPPLMYKSMIIVIKKILPRYAFVQTSMVDRMTRDMVFDHSDATQDFDYSPRNFKP